MKTENIIITGCFTVAAIFMLTMLMMPLSTIYKAWLQDRQRTEYMDHCRKDGHDEIECVQGWRTY